MLIELITLSTACTTSTTEVMELKTEFIAVPSSRVQPGNPEETLGVSSQTNAIFLFTVTGAPPMNGTRLFSVSSYNIEIDSSQDATSVFI